MRSILTPKTIYKNRIGLTKVFGRISGEEFSLENLDSWELQLNKKKLLDGDEKQRIIRKIKPSLHDFHLLMKLWLARTRHLIKIRSQVAGILEQYCQPYCIYCLRRWGLKCEGINDIEITFNNFLLESKEVKKFRLKKASKDLRLAKKVPDLEEVQYSCEHWDVSEWQLYFRLNTVFRTLCYHCYAKIYYTKLWNQKKHGTAF